MKKEERDGQLIGRILGKIRLETRGKTRWNAVKRRKSRNQFATKAILADALGLSLDEHGSNLLRKN